MIYKPKWKEIADEIALSDQAFVFDVKTVWIIKMVCAQTVYLWRVSEALAYLQKTLQKNVWKNIVRDETKEERTIISLCDRSS